MWPTYYASLTQRTWQQTMQQSLLATQAKLIFNYNGKCEGNWLD
jgi:hypothetical protein